MKLLCFQLNEQKNPLTRSQFPQKSLRAETPPSGNEKKPRTIDLPDIPGEQQRVRSKYNRGPGDLVRQPKKTEEKVPPAQLGAAAEPLPEGERAQRSLSAWMETGMTSEFLEGLEKRFEDVRDYSDRAEILARELRLGILATQLVKGLQKMLNTKNFNLKVDGKLGPKTLGAMKVEAARRGMSSIGSNVSSDSK